MNTQDFVIKNGILKEYTGNATSVVIPNSVTKIGNGAFFECTSLTEVVIPNSVTQIGSGAFYGCRSLKKLVIPNSVTQIWDMAFYGCISLKKLVIPNSVTQIWSGAFGCCISLKKVVIPNSVTQIGNRSFECCTSLTEVVLPEKFRITNTQIKAILEKSIIENRECDDGDGLCAIIAFNTQILCGFFLGFYFLPLFTKEIAIEKFNGKDCFYWWDLANRHDRENMLEYLLQNI